MKRKTKELNSIIDNVTAGIRDEAVEPSVIDDAAERVWDRLSNETAFAQAEIVQAAHIEGCADFQSLIPAYLRGNLSEARTLLLVDHTHECIPCRRALKQARGGNVAAPVKTIKHGTAKRYGLQPVVLRWGIAAALVIGLGLLALPLIQRLTPFGGALDATVQAADGPVYRVTDAENRRVNAGEKVQRGETLRTAKDAHAEVRLSDGSLIEMKDRSEFSITENSQGATIHLDRGNVIVQAAKQKSRHLYVATNDALVSVTGTTFAVNSGTKGSRVSVIEGEVRLDHAGQERVLRPGEQAATQPSIARVPVKDEIGWSRNAQRYIETLASLSALRKDLDNVPRPGVRNSTRLLDLAPENTVLYAALPNLSATLSESNRIMQERIKQNATLRQWWERERNSPRRGPGMEQTIERIRQFGEYLGDEISISAEMDEKGNPVGPLVLAELKNAAGFRPFLDQQIKSFSTGTKNVPSVRVIDDPLMFATTQDEKAQSGNAQDGKTNSELFIWMHDDLLAVSPKLQMLQRLAANLKTPGANRFTTTQFYARIADVYSEGAGLVVAADLERIIATEMRDGGKLQSSKQQAEALKQLGLTNLKYFIVEQKEGEGKTHSRAVLSFNEQRKGIASWLAAPGPMGSLEYVSQDANIAAAFVVKEPVALVDDLLGVLETVSPGLRQQLGKIEAEHGLKVREDFAAPLGGEFAFAIDGPILPTPSWKMIFEVNDPTHLQKTFERVVEEINVAASKEGKAGLKWERAEVGGRIFYTLKSSDFGVEVNYVFVNGYLIAAPSRALVDRAIRFHDSGYTLLRSPRFTAGLPADGNANFSALVYHDLAPLLQPLAQRMSDSSQQLPQEQQQALKALAADTPPTLAYAYAQGDRIVFAANTEGGPFGLSIGSLLGMPNAFAIQHILGEAMRGKAPKR